MCGPDLSVLNLSWCLCVHSVQSTCRVASVMSSLRPDLPHVLGTPLTLLHAADGLAECAATPSRFAGHRPRSDETLGQSPLPAATPTYFAPSRLGQRVVEPIRAAAQVQPWHCCMRDTACCVCWFRYSGGSKDHTLCFVWRHFARARARRRVSVSVRVRV